MFLAGLLTGVLAVAVVLFFTAFIVKDAYCDLAEQVFILSLIILGIMFGCFGVYGIHVFILSFTQ